MSGDIQITDWISAISNAVVAVGLVLVWLQVRIAAKGLAVSQLALASVVEQVTLQRKAIDQVSTQIDLAKSAYTESHELERRKTAIQLIRDWADFLHKNGTGAKAFAETLDFQNTKLLWQEKQLDIPLKLKAYLEKTVPSIGPIQAINESTARLTEPQSSIIRREAVSYLNTIETILAARRHGIADPDMLEEQFANLVAPSDGKQILVQLRNIAGGVSAFPSIEDFVREVGQKKETLTKKAKLGSAV